MPSGHPVSQDVPGHGHQGQMQHTFQTLGNLYMPTKYYTACNSVFYAQAPNKEIYILFLGRIRLYVFLTIEVWGSLPQLETLV